MMNKFVNFVTIIFICILLQSTQAMAQYHHRYHFHEQNSSGIIKATYYGPGFNGHHTASGEIFNAYGLTAAHRSLPFGTIIEVVNPNNGKRCRVRINDRGPYRNGYSLDLAQGAARILGFTSGLLKMFIVK